jgi:hypothetical protein
MNKYVNVASLEQGNQQEPIWALNGSSESDIGQPGEIHVGIPKVNGSKIDDLYLPQTWLPTCLTDQIPRGQLLASSEFRGAVNNRLVVLISAEFAAEIQAQDGADEERQRLNELRRAVREATSSRSITESGAEVISTSEIQDRGVETSASTELDSGFVLFANNLETKSDVEALNLIRSRGKFSGRELRHLLKELKDKPKVVAFINSRLEK